jgi:hypothetical protein
MSYQLAETEKLLKPYIDLSRELRHIVSSVVHSGNYEFLRGPSHIKRANCTCKKPRFNILTRPVILWEEERKRNLGVGHDEAMFLIYGMLRDHNDYHAGFDLVKCHGHFRIVLGQNIAYPDLLESLEVAIKDNKDIVPNLNAGLYPEFVNDITDIFNQEVHCFKDLHTDISYMTEHYLINALASHLQSARMAKIR